MINFFSIFPHAAAFPAFISVLHTYVRRPPYADNLPCIYLVRLRQPIIDQQGPGLSGLIHEEAHPVASYLL